MTERAPSPDGAARYEILKGMSQKNVEIVKTAVAYVAATGEPMWSITRDGSAVRLDYYNNPEQALQQVGLQSRDETAQGT
jgi:hypothetical protein